jgi:8-oxo-dGTP pyrophosphatase MutT (NUDIX family)
MPPVPVHPDPAATVVALRPADEGFEVLMVERNTRGFFAGLMVFPGGRVDAHDVPEGGTLDDDVSHRLAAIRELAEETGILLTGSGPVASPDLKGEAWRSWIETRPGLIDTEGLVYVSRWVTPESAPRRFDTRFYLAACPGAPQVRIDGEELVGHSWVTPAEALRRHEEGAWRMMTPTIAHLGWLRRRSSIADALDSALGAETRASTAPSPLADGSIVPVLLPEMSA